MSKLCSKLKANNLLLKQIQDLFSYRNNILHVSPEFIEQYGLPDGYFSEPIDESEFKDGVRSREISIEQLVRKPGMMFTPPGDMSLEAAEEHYVVANKFLKGLISFENK